MPAPSCRRASASRTSLLSVEVERKQPPRDGVEAALKTATDALLSELGPEGFWTGYLSSSALSTATAVAALSAVDRANHVDENDALREGGLRWLAANQNADGGWGDTTRSKSNISTTALCWAAMGVGAHQDRYAAVAERAVGWLSKASGTRGDVREHLP